MPVRVWRAVAALPALLLTLLILAGYAGATVKTGPVGSWVKARGPAVPPAGVDMDFTASAAGLTVTRAGTAYMDNLAGTWTSVAANTARQSDKGLLVEEARTNAVRNNGMAGAVAGSPGTLPTNWPVTTTVGLTQTVVGTGTQSGVDYIDLRFNGTTTGTAIVVNFDAISSFAATQNQFVTLSAFLAITAGSLANISVTRFSFDEYNSVPTFLSNQLVTVAPTGTLTRLAGTVTMVQATAAFVSPSLRFITTNGAAVDFTVRIGWPQVEIGSGASWATSPIRTTSAAVSRAADVVTLTSPPAFGAAHTIAGNGMPQAPAAYPTIQYFVGLSDGTATNSWFIGRNGASGVPFWSLNGATAGIGAISWAQSAAGGLAGANAASSQAASLNGAAVTTGSSAASPTGLNKVSLGAGPGGASSYWNGYFTRLRLWPTTRLSDIQVQQASQ